jgi:RHH-type transcriptional regulator, rel operon repressor / antitoxin RelB
MTKQTVISARVDPAISDRLDALAAATDRSRAWLVAQAVRELIERDQELMALLRPGLDDIAAGRVRSSDDMAAKFRHCRERVSSLSSKAAA